MALVVIPAYCICKYIQSVLSTPHASQRENYFGVLTFEYPMVLHRFHCSGMFSPPFMLSIIIGLVFVTQIISKSYMRRGSKEWINYGKNTDFFTSAR